MQLTTMGHGLGTLAMLGIVLAVACADGGGPTVTDSEILKGFAAAESNDTIATVPPPEAPPTPGAFHGFVLGHGTAPDTMSNAPRLEGVTVTAYPHLGWSGSDPVVGEAAAERTTDAQGAFQFPTLPGGDYIVTFVPPASSTYGNTYVTTTIHSGSDEGNWWVILPFK